jgi:hypothetical protein
MSTTVPRSEVEDDEPIVDAPKEPEKKEEKKEPAKLSDLPCSVLLPTLRWSCVQAVAIAVRGHCTAIWRPFPRFPTFLLH